MNVLFRFASANIRAFFLTCKKNYKKNEKKYIFVPDMGNILYIIIAFCGSLLLPAMTFAQQSELRFDEEKWYFGDIKEDGGNVEHSFTFTNTTSKPVVILDVTSGCGCTTPKYSRKPVMPGEKGEVVVSFDPMNRPGRFSKGVAVQTSASSSAFNLIVEGNVLPRVKSTEELYPFDMGQGVRFTSNFHAFTYIGRGEKVSEKIGWINTSDKDLSLQLVGKEQSGLLRIDAPKVLKAGNCGDILLEYAVPATSDRYGSLSDVMSVIVGGKEARPLLSCHAIAIDKFDRETEDIERPIAELSKNFIKFGDVKQGKTVEDATIELSNDGDSELIIRAVEWQNRSLSCSLKAGDTIAAGRKISLKITFDSSDCDFGVWVDRVRIITNDPMRPMQTVRVTAIVTN